ncbi:hypothetical protein CsatB_015704 [Cannabis sativa]
MMSISINVLGFLLLLSIATNVSSNRPQCIPKEREALLKFKTTLNSPKGYLSSWSNSSTTQNCCKWLFITCDDQTNHVVSIVIGEIVTTLDGDIDSSLAELHHLKELYLINMNISHIPIFIGSFKELTDLYICGNPIIGIIPPQLGNLTKLENLFLQSTSQMIIDNPRWLSQLTSLKELLLSNCQLLKVPNHISSSSLSHSNYSFTSLQKIDIDDSFIHPTTITWLLNSSAKLYHLDLSYNNLSGTLHDLLGNISSSTKNSLENLYLSSNQLGGLILDDFKNTFPSLTNLRLDNNQLEGHFPNRLKRFPNLKSLDISHNQLVGLLPDLSSLPNLESFEASNNKFSGASSESIGKLDSLYLLDVSSNSLTGCSIPPSLLVNATRLYLSNNKFNEFSSSLCEAKEQDRSTQLLDLSNNNLFENIPDCWENFTQLVVLNLGYNKLFGNIPNSINMKSIKTLQLRHNNFSGNFPSSLKYCTSLLVLDLGNNRLEGPIPSWIGEKLSNLVFLSLKLNKFDGIIPLGLCQLTQIQILDLSSNDLSRAIPSCIKNFTSMIRVNNSRMTIPSDVRFSEGPMPDMSIYRSYCEDKN